MPTFLYLAWYAVFTLCATVAFGAPNLNSANHVVICANATGTFLCFRMCWCRYSTASPASLSVQREPNLWSFEQSAYRQGAATTLRPAFSKMTTFCAIDSVYREPICSSY